MTPRPPAGPARAFPLLAIVLALVVAGGGAAAIAWTSQSTLLTSVRAPPVELEMGSGASKTRYFDPFALSINKTTVAGTVSGKAGADVVVKDVLRVVNRDGVSRTVTLSATQVTNSRVEAFTWTARDGSATVGVLDHRAASPRTTLTLAAGASRALDLRLDLAEGAGKNNATFTFDMRLEVAS